MYRYIQGTCTLLNFQVIMISLYNFSVAGTVGAIATCPLEVVKTRLQSSVTHFHPAYIQSHTTTYVPRTVVSNVHLYTSAGSITADSHIIQNGYHHQKRHVSLLQCLKYVNLIFIYFKAKQHLKCTLPLYFSPRNENLNLLVRIKFLNLFLYSSK
jgi:hypothetical protein